MRGRNVELVENTTLLTQTVNFQVLYEGHCVIECERWVYIDFIQFSRWLRVIDPDLGSCQVCQIRCTFSYLNWVFVFMASVNYISGCHGSFLNWTHVMTSSEGTDGKQYHECPLVNMILIGFQWLPIWCPIVGTTSHLAKLPGDHLHL